jgi:hypothetical protein
MTKWLRFADLKARGIVGNRTQLRRLIYNHGFPPGRLIGPNSRAYEDDKVERWLEQRPVAPKPSPKRKIESAGVEAR